MTGGIGAPAHLTQQLFPLLARRAAVLPVGARKLAPMIEELHVVAFERFDLAFDEFVECGELVLDVCRNREVHALSSGADIYHGCAPRSPPTAT